MMADGGMISGRREPAKLVWLVRRMEMENGEKYLPVCDDCHSHKLREVYGPGMRMCEVCSWVGGAPSAQDVARKLAFADVMGFSTGPFTAVTWRKSLPKEWQEEVEDIIVNVYHNT